MASLFNFQEYSEVLATTIRDNLKNKNKPIVIGIHGEWGSGKTTLLQEIVTTVEKSNNRDFIIIPILFNAWRFEKEEHLVIPLLKTLYYKLEKRELLKKYSIFKESFDFVKDKLDSIISSLEFELKANIPTIIDAKLKYSGKNVEEEKKQKDFSRKYESIYFDIINKIKELTEDNKNGTVIKFLFLIDDLDRCLPENSVKMLESIKLFLDIENCAFVMAIDKEVVELGVEYHYQNYRNSKKRLPITGSEYLEKIITLPFLLPSIQKEKIKEFIENNYAHLFINDNRLLTLFCDTVPTIPRKIIRSLDLYDYKLKLNRALKTDIDKHIILVISLIELFIPELYRHVKKEFERDRKSDSQTFELLINSKNSANNSGKSITKIEIENEEISYILKRFSQSRSKFNIDTLFDYILDYDNFQKDLKRYYTFDKKISK